VINKVSVTSCIPPFDRGMNGCLKAASFYSSCRTTPTEDAKASSAFFHTVNFAGAYGVSHFSSNTLRVPVSAGAPGRDKFTHPHGSAVHFLPPPPPPII
jgi:hypothetical protein